MQIHHLSGRPFVGLASCFDTGTGFLYGPSVLLKPNPDYQHFSSNWSLVCSNGVFTPIVCCGLCVVALVTGLILLKKIVLLSLLGCFWGGHSIHLCHCTLTLALNVFSGKDPADLQH